MASRLNLSSALRSFLAKVHHRNTTSKPTPAALCSHCCSTHTGKNGDQLKVCQNPLGIQMLSKGLHKQIFRRTEQKGGKSNQNIEKLVRKSLKHLEKHGLESKESSPLPDVNFKVPKLYGSNIDEHFQTLALKYSDGYLQLSKQLAGAELPSMPSSWVFQKGWTKYVAGEEPVKVRYPEEQAIVFDVEVCMSEGSFPTMATAVSPSAW